MIFKFGTSAQNYNLTFFTALCRYLKFFGTEINNNFCQNLKYKFMIHYLLFIKK